MCRFLKITSQSLFVFIFLSFLGIFLFVNEVSAQTTEPIVISRITFKNPVNNTTMTSPFPVGTRSVVVSFTTAVATECKYASVDGLNYTAHFGKMATTGGTVHSTTIGKSNDPIEGPLSDGTSYTFYVECNRNIEKQNDPDSTIKFEVSGVNQTKLPGSIPSPYFANANMLLELVPTYESIGVYAKYSDDKNQNNSAKLYFKGPNDTSWKEGMQLTHDTRHSLISSEWQQINHFKNQWRGSLLGVVPETNYQVKVVMSDSDGITCPGTLPAGTSCNVVNSTSVELVGSVTTRSYNHPSGGGRTFIVAPNGGSPTCLSGSTGTTFGKIQAAVDCATQPGDTVIVQSGTYNITAPITVSSKGNAGAYITIKAQNLAAQFVRDRVVRNTTAGATTIINAQNSTDCDRPKCGFKVSGEFIKVQGFEIINARIGIQVANPANNIVIENNHIHNNFVNTTDPSSSHPIKVGQGSKNMIHSVTVQHNWTDAVKIDPTGGHVITFVGTMGRNVARQNYINFNGIWGGNGEHGTDCIGSTLNDSIYGLGPDSDIYNNICDSATDDGFEPEGNGMNNRIWGNKVFRSNLGIAVAAIIVGPTYVFRNGFYDLDNHWTESCVGVKTGEAGTGDVYFYHNTFYLGDASDCINAKNGQPTATGIAPAGGGYDGENMVFQNNIFHGYQTSVQAGQADPQVEPPLLNYNLHYRESTTGPVISWLEKSYSDFNQYKTASGHLNEINAKPVYEDVSDNTPVIDKKLRLKAGSPGINAGVRLLGFNDENSAWPANDAPDIGACETGSTSSKDFACQGGAEIPQGDINKDRKIDLIDYNRLLTDFDKSDSTALASDLNSNGKVDIFDLAILQTNYGKSY